MKSFSLFCFFLVLCNTLDAQYLNDVARYSVIRHGNLSARGMGTGGSMGALGADISVLATNPAGLAAFRKPEITITPGFDIYHTKSTYDDNPLKKAKVSFVPGNIGAIFAKTDDEARWKTFNFGLSYARLINHSRSFNYESTTPGSITEHYAALANGKTPDFFNSFEEELAWETFLIDADTNSTGNQYYSSLLNVSTRPLNKSQTVEAKGRSDEINISVAGNFEHKLYVGASLGIGIIDYEETRTYQEEENEEIVNFESLRLRETFTTDGNAFTLKLGTIYRISQDFRIGLAFHSPTAYSLIDVFSNSIRSNFRSGQTYDAASEEGLSEYTLRTPWRILFNSAYFIKRKGFISAEVEFLDYSRSKFDFDIDNNPNFADFQEQLNAEIKSNLAPAINARLGGEFAHKKLRARLGYGFYSSPYQNDVLEISGISHTANGGLGFQLERLRIDLGYMQVLRNEGFSPYETNASSKIMVRNEMNQHRLLLSLVYKY